MVAGAEKAPAPAAAVGKNGPVLEVAALTREGDKHKGPLRVEGVVVDRQGKVVYYHVGYAAGDETKIEEEVRQGLGRVE